MEASTDLLAPRCEIAPNPKGKEKLEETKTGDAAICGICFTDGGLGPRGRIDSCDHYFCFVCIMEWAKVESRCPMCKQRFYSVRRSEVPGLFVSERVLEIPVRNQVYHPLGNESTAISDPYAQANCRVCHGYGDEQLLLLCDLCDSAFHTYCAGLGHTVPEGDWYCNDCTILREEYARIERDVDYRDQASQESHSSIEISGKLVSIFENVADERSSRSKSSVNQHFHESSVPGGHTSQQRTSKDIFLHVEGSESSVSPSQITSPHLQGRLVKQRARALQRSCNLKSRVQVLRDNWNSLRSGSVDFSSVFDNKDKASASNRITSRLSKQSNSSLANKEQVTDSNYSRVMPTNNSMSQDVDKAWKMMQKAKKQKLTIDRSSMNLMALISTFGAIAASKGDVNHPFNGLTSKNRNEVDKMVGFSTPGTTKLPFIKTVHDKNQSFIGGKLVDAKALNPCQRVGRVGLPTSNVVQKISPRQLAYVESNEPACSSLSSPTCNAIKRPLRSFQMHMKGLGHDGERAVRKCSCRSPSKARGISENNAKCEVQSLVKLNLKLLSKGQSLGTERFKEVARASTHSILAACGLEHSKSVSHKFSKKICKHNTKSKMLHRSNLMPDSCRECFYSFAKDVVKSILFEVSTSNNHR